MWDIKRQVKAGDSPEIVRPVVHKFLAARSHRTTVIYTDGSKTENSVGAEVINDNIQRAIGLPAQCSVFSAEAFAIKSAVDGFSSTNNLLLLSDSASCLSAIENGSSQHPWIQEIERLLENHQIQLCWIPGHAGIRGNEEADRLANAGRDSIPLDVGILGSDARKTIKQSIRREWESRWTQLTDVKLREIKFDTTKWNDRDNAVDQRVLTRLRIGHTRLTHDFLLKKSSPPVCDCCGTTVDVRHLILQCKKFKEARRKYQIDPTSLRLALCNDRDNEDRLLSFLREVNVYCKL